MQFGSPIQVQGAESLMVRVVSNVDKKLEVKQRFLDVFKEEDYPTEYPYKSKIGYLEYCKRRGLTSCYIWAFPPLKGEDNILYCHLEIQKTPKSDKLHECYLTMLKKAMRENIIVELTNLHDHFFVPMDESKAKVTTVRLPYFDGDYWPSAAEDFIMQLQQEEEDGHKQQKKGKTKKTAIEWATKAAAQAQLTSNASKDALLMQRILFYFKIRCYEAQKRLDEREWHPANGREKHSFYPIEVPDVPTDTTDKDELVESEFFDTRQAFLSLCQGSHYQYDTFHHAKHSDFDLLL